jgi:hypothetical protein
VKGKSGFILIYLSARPFSPKTGWQSIIFQ